ncbi:MAG: sigma-70 family RNA polymerase sigma factor [Oscillospiraceae bacterium]
MTAQSSFTNDCIEDIVNQYSDMVYRLALARTKNHADAQDVFQDVFVRYMKAQDKITSDEHLKAWLIRATINCSKNLFSSAWYKKTVALDETLATSMGEKSDVYYAVLTLPKKYRTVVHLFYFEDMSIAEISEITNVNQSTIKSQLSRARTMLKDTLRKEYDYV